MAVSPGIGCRGDVAGELATKVHAIWLTTMCNLSIDAERQDRATAGTLIIESQTEHDQMWQPTLVES